MCNRGFEYHKYLCHITQKKPMRKGCFDAWSFLLAKTSWLNCAIFWVYFHILICTLMSEEHFKLLWDCEASHTEKNCSHGNMWIKMDTFNNSFSSFAMYICFQIPLAAWLSWDIHSILCCCWKRQTKNCWRQHQQMDFYHEESMVCCHISIVSSVCLRCVPPFYVFKNGYKSEATCGRLFPRRASQKL